MKQLYTLAFTACLAMILLISCQQELHFPEEKPTSKFTVVVEGKTYNLNIDYQTTRMGDTSQVDIAASSPDFVVTLNSRSDQHNSGVGEYFLWCCRNDVFDLTSGTRKHWETEHIGNIKQKGSVTITKMNAQGYEGTYILHAKDGTPANANRRTYTGTFTIIY